jgi:PAS domain S-box-containing protein
MLCQTANGMNKPGSILVVDDEVEIRHLFSKCLAMAGYEVSEAGTGAECLEIVRQKTPDLVLLDVRLPDMSGMNVCRQIKGDTGLQDVLVILCSGEATSIADKVDGLGTGADEYVAKPVSLEELLARIRTLMRLRDTVAALRASEEHHRRLINILPDAVCLIRPDGQLLSVNSQAVAMLGHATPAELLRKNVFDLTSAEDHERIKTDITVTLKAGIIRNAEYTMLKADGTQFLVEWSATVSYGADGRPAGLVCVVRDVTERRRTGERIRQLLDLLDQAHDAIIVRDLDQGIHYFNKGAQRILGFSEPEVRGRRVTDLFFQDVAAFAAAQATLLQTGEWNGELLGLAKDKRPIIFQSRWTLVRGENGSSPLVVSIYTDVTERKLTEEKLKEQEALSQRIIGAAMEGYCRLDLTGRFLDVNEAYCRMTGYTRKELLSMRISDLDVNTLSPEETTQHIQHILKAGSDRYETRHCRKDGQLIDVEVIASSLKLRDNYIFAFLRDTTERKQAESLLRASEERFRQMADNIREVFWMTDQGKNEMIFVSRGYEEIWGRTCQSLYESSLSWIEALHPDDRERVVDSVFSKQAMGQYDEVYRIIRPDGTIRWIQDRAFPIRDDGGNVYRIVGIAEDITKRKEVWDALCESEARKSAIMRVALDGIITIDHTGRIVELNSAAEKIFTHHRSKLVGEDVMQIIPPSLRPWFQDGLAKCFTGEKGPAAGSRIEMTALRADGSRFFAELTITRIRLKGQPTFTLYIRDITQRKRAEEELRSLHRRVIEVQEAERLRIAFELHDGINQLIASVKMRLNKVQENLPDLKPAAREILSRCDHLLIKALEENRRIAHNLRPSDLDHLGLTAACRNFCNEFQSRTSLAVQCKVATFSRRLPAAVELNLFRIVQEAINNIEKHAHAKTVKLQLSLRDDAIHLKIQDDGRGFDLKKPNVNRKKGHGLGLTSIRERALSLGGTCKVKSAPKKGTTISVSVPLKEPAKEA